MITRSFHTATGQTVPAVTADEMRTVDRVAVETVGLTLLQMMENAGRTLAGMARELAGGESVVVIAGGGGNGGGGLCAARHLVNHGIPVRAVLDRSPDELSGVAARQCRLLEETGATVESDPMPEEAGVVVDALIGYGRTGVVQGRAAYLISQCNRTQTPVCSLDVPSGLDATTGDRHGPVVDADYTLTLALPKTGLGGVGNLWLADIGIPNGVYERLGIDYRQPFDGRDRVRVKPEP
ncbi:MAG: NAD(P)H-hydrate epimerase [Halobacteriota archaeon]